jgi:hypothetical protein
MTSCQQTALCRDSSRVRCAAQTTTLEALLHIVVDVSVAAVQGKRFSKAFESFLRSYCWEATATQSANEGVLDVFTTWS